MSGPDTGLQMARMLSSIGHAGNLGEGEGGSMGHVLEVSANIGNTIKAALEQGHMLRSAFGFLATITGVFKGGIEFAPMINLGSLSPSSFMPKLGSVFGFGKGGPQQ